MQTNQSKLTTAEWELYNFLKDNSDKWVKQVEIAVALPNCFPFTEEDLLDFHNSNCRKAITKAIRSINSNDVIQKIILSTGKGIKIANREEYEHFIGRKIVSAVRHLQRVKKLADKASKDGQMRIVFNKERDTIEAFIKNYEEMNNEL